ncbi:hypothetical protein BS329_25320 [Amycolatopsis coloradensis]|uniref:Uncharacterized protein n=1 Tax=Amycolatopsis coloradensis TaxID=76021 RepID=A0A1R0KNQ7_9PSEU|nr:hypothetical protein [Amycolatopsis coloradensis]OLZ48423.1 hypothetical protein BS329_25320 [Amycolatopsis coloradensis]
MIESTGYASYTVASSHGRYDLTDYNDRYQLRQEVAHNQRNSDEASQRISRRFEVLRKRGIPHHQGRRFGFGGLDRTVPREEWVDEDGKDTRKPVPAELVERERKALRDATDAVLAGVFQSTIADEWNAAGLLTIMGKTWLPRQVGEVLLRPISAGLIEHDGVVAAPGTATSAGMQLSGMLSLTSSLVSAAQKDNAQRVAALDHAADLAVHVGVWRMSVALEAGEHADAIKIAETVDPTALPTPTRRSA